MRGSCITGKVLKHLIKRYGKLKKRHEKKVIKSLSSALSKVICKYKEFKSTEKKCLKTSKTRVKKYKVKVATEDIGRPIVNYIKQETEPVHNENENEKNVIPLDRELISLTEKHIKQEQENHEPVHNQDKTIERELFSLIESLGHN